MLAHVVAIAVVLLPFVAVVVALLLAERFQRGQAVRAAQQIAVTDAIHRELGAVAAPSMAKHPWGAARLVVPLPLERPQIAGAVLAIAHRVLRGWEASGARRIEIVVVPQPERPTRAARRAA